MTKMTSTASIRTTVHLEKTSRVRVHVAEEGIGLAHLTIATGDLTFGLAISGDGLDALIADLTTIRENARAAEPTVVEPVIVPRTRLDDVLDRIRVAS